MLSCPCVVYVPGCRQFKGGTDPIPHIGADFHNTIAKHIAFKLENKNIILKLDERLQERVVLLTRLSQIFSTGRVHFFKSC